MKLLIALITAGILVLFATPGKCQKDPNEKFDKKSQQMEKVNANHGGYQAPAPGQEDNGNSMKQENVAKQKTGSGAYADYPKYVNTGNPEQDKANYYQAKQAWIDAHPEEYKKMTGNREHKFKQNSKDE